MAAPASSRCGEIRKEKNYDRKTEM